MSDPGATLAPAGGYPAWYATEVLDAVAGRIGPLAVGERDQLYGALYAAAATGASAWLDPADFNTGALATIVGEGRSGPCARCGGSLAEHALDLGGYPWLTCPRPAARKPNRDWRGIAVAAALWVALPILSLGILSWVPSLVAAVRHRGRGWGVAAAWLMLCTFSFWSQPDPGEQLRMSLWLGSAVYGATQIAAWLRARGGADADPIRPQGPLST